MSDGFDGSGQIPRRSPRVNDHAAPVSGVLAIVLAAVAVIAGFLILRSITDDSTAAGGVIGSGSSGDSDTDDSTTTTIGTGSTVATTPVITEPPFITTGASVVVANANGQGGSAGRVGAVLASAAQFEIADPPVNANASSDDLATSAIFYDSTNPAALNVANSLNRVLGGALPVAVIPADGPPTLDGEMSGGSVLLMLGDDFAAATAADLDLTMLGVPPADSTAGTTPASGSTTGTSVPAG